MVKQLILPLAAALAGVLVGAAILLVGGMVALVCAEKSKKSNNHSCKSAGDMV